MQQKYSYDEEILGKQITEEQVDSIEVECGFCGKLIRIRSLADHIGFEHSTQFE